MLLTLVAVALLLVPSSCSDADAASSAYVSQLDENGKAVYDSLSVFATSQDAVLTINADFPRIELYDDEQSAKNAAILTVNNALAAKYLSDPYGIWLWDLPVKSVEIEPAISPISLGEKSYYTVVSVSFDLSVPEKYKTTVSETLKEVKDAAKTFEGTESEKAKAIAKHLSGITKEDEEGTVSDLYDALVNKSASSFGVAAAYTYLAGINGVDAVTVKGDYYGSTDEGKTYCWNAVCLDNAWYGVDCYNKCIMAGSGTKVSTVPFISAYLSDLDMKSPNDLVSPELNRTAYPYPDDTPFLEKYGAYILVALMVAIVVASLYYGVRKGYA